ncbi:hypothetical protein F4809DRAFT_636866 [Biscogniauxia mediterranea]|nr:hypothetical protein F4809DRAFT_636866 [Biscogniauxia mediterranea]
MDHTHDYQEDSSLWGDAEQLGAFDQDPTDGQNEHHEPIESVYPDPETLESTAYASYSQAQTPDLQLSVAQPTSLASPARLTFPQPMPQLTWPSTSSTFQATTPIPSDNATVYGPVSYGNDAIVDGASGENYNATIDEPATQVYDASTNESGLENAVDTENDAIIHHHEPATQVYDASINESGLENAVDTENHAIIHHPESEGGNPAIPSTAPTMAAPDAAHPAAEDTLVDDLLRELYANEMKQAKAYFKGLDKCPICEQNKKQMFRHVASHVKKCELGACEKEFSSPGALGDHIINYKYHNAGGDGCCFGCNVYPQCRTWELSIHMRQHMVAFLVARGRLGELSRQQV